MASVDPLEDNIRFAKATTVDVIGTGQKVDKKEADFPMLSDPTKETAKAYGVLTSKMGMSYAKRETFLIDPHGKIARHYRDVDPEKNSKQVLADLAALQTSAG